MTSESTLLRGAAVVILAAGESTRMERPKQLLDWGGVPLVRYQAEQAARAGFEAIVVVLGHLVEEVLSAMETAPLPPRTSIVVNRDYREGKTTTIKAGLRTLMPSTAAVAILSVDQPRPAEVLRRLLEMHLRGGHRISVPVFQGKHGHPPVFEGALIPELLRITEEGQGIREVIERHRDALREIAFADPLVRTNLNTPEDYEVARRIAGLSN